jgi:membrane-bound lytic murein transglycosylase D
MAFPRPPHRTLALAVLLAWQPAAFAAVDAFVNVTGERAAATASAVQGANPKIDKLLSQPSDLWERIRQGFAMPDLDGKLVAQQAAFYAARPELVQAIVLRARRYLYFIVDEVERRGLPTELALLPFIESGFNPNALSSAQASGLWQFIPETGAKYNLAQSASYDGRRDVVASTGAALDYLQFLHEFNRSDWHRALASYNWGESAVARAVERNRVRGLPEAYDSLTMPDETRSYVPRLLAIKQIVLDPAAFGIELPEIPNEPFFGVVRVPVDLDLRLAAQFAQTPLEDFLALNPAFNSKLVAGAAGAGLAIPLEKAEIFKVNLERHREAMARQAASASAHRKAPKKPPVTRF